MRCAACRRVDDGVVHVHVDGATLPLCPGGDCEAALDAGLVDVTALEPWPPAERAAAPASLTPPAHRS